MPAATIEKDGFDGDALHFEKNSPDKPPVKFAPYRRRPFPTCVYREWASAEARADEVYRAGAKSTLDMSNPRDISAAEKLVPQHESRIVGVLDIDDDGAIHSALREQNERELADLLANGWADHPSGIKAAKDRMNKRIALAAGERAYDDRHLGEKAKAELDAVEDAADQHVVDVAETRRDLREQGALPKGKR